MKELWVKNKKGEIKHICVNDYFDLSDYEIIEEPKSENEPESFYEEEQQTTKTEKEELPPQFKKENGEIVPKTMEEMLADGTITQDDYNEYLVLNYKQYLNSTDWVVIKTLELQMKGEKVTHDYSDILAEREKAREEINKLEKEVENE